VRLVAEQPLVPEYRQALAMSHHNLGVLLAGQGKADEAAGEYRAALKELVRLVAEQPLVPEYREDLAMSHNNLGLLLAGQGKADEAARAYRAALKELVRLVAEQPLVPDFQNDLANNLVNLAWLRNATKDWREAQKHLERARPHHEAALRADPRNIKYRRFYCNNLLALSVSLLGLGDHAAAAETASKLAQCTFDPRADSYDSGCLLSRCIPLGEKDTRLSESKRKELVKTYADQAMDRLRQAVKAGWKDAAHMKKDTDLDPLRGREDFQKLLAELELNSRQKSATTTKPRGGR
jgi:tetratricopeptide (TPR) repeat protein